MKVICSTLAAVTVACTVCGCAQKLALPPKDQIPPGITPEVRQAILDLYGDNPKAAADKLGNMGEKAKEAVPYLIPIARWKTKSGAEASVRRTAIVALGKIGDERAVDALVEALNYPDQLVQSVAASALGKIGSPRAIVPLVKALETSDNSRTASSTWRALAEIGDSQAVEPLIAALSRRKDYVRGNMASALGELGDRRAVEPLLQIYREDQYNSKAALGALIKLKDERAIDIYLECIRNAADYGRTMRRAAAECVVQLDHPKAVAARREAQTVVEKNTPIVEITRYNLIIRERVSERILNNRKGEQVASKLYLYHGLSNILMSILVSTKPDDKYVGSIACDPSGRPEKEKYLCLDILGDVIYIDGEPAFIEVAKPIKQFSRTYSSRDVGSREKIREIYPLDDPNNIGVEGCRYLW